MQLIFLNTVRYFATSYFSLLCELKIFIITHGTEMLMITSLGDGWKMH